MNNQLPIPDDIVINHITPYLSPRNLKTLRLSCKAYAYLSELKKQQSSIGFKTVVGAQDIFLYEVDRLFVSGNHFKKVHQSNQKKYFSHYLKPYIGYFSQVDFKELGLALDEGIEYLVENGQEQQTNVMVLTTKNRLLAYGNNTKGQLGFNHCYKIKRMRQVPVFLNHHEKIKQLEMGYDFSVILTSTHRILVTGQFGLIHPKQFSHLKVNLDNKETIQQIDVKGKHIFLKTSKYRLLMTDGRYEQTATIFSLQEIHFKPVHFKIGVGERLKDIGYLPGLIIAVANDGKIYFSGDGHPQLKQGISKLLKDGLRVQKIHVNQENKDMPFVLLLLDNHKLYSYGNNNCGQLGAIAVETMTPLREVHFNLGQDQINQIYSRFNLSLIVTQQGRLMVSGYNEGNKAYQNSELVLFQKFTQILSRQPYQLYPKQPRMTYLHLVVGFLTTFIQDITLGTRSYKGAFLLGVAGGFIQIFIENIIERWCAEKLGQQVKASLYL
jgi:hypothetical protein